MLIQTESHPAKNKQMHSDPQRVENCVNCAGESFTQVIEGYDFDTGKKDFALERCDNCQLTRTTPLLNARELAPYYDSGYYGSPNKKFNSIIETWTIFSNNRLANRILRSADKQQSHSKEKLRVLDIGCGRANLLKAFNRHGCECFGVERSNFPDDPALRNITIYKQDFLDIDFEKNKFDVVVIWHVLEHLTDPAGTLIKVGEILKPNGKLIIAVPNFGGLQSKLFGKHWFHLDLPRHTYHFTRQSVQSMLNNAGLSVSKVTTRSFDQGIYGFVQSAINSMAISTPNMLYSILKSTQEKPGIATTILQILLAGLLAPFALMEYLLSGISGTGACLILRADKNKPIQTVRKSS